MKFHDFISEIDFSSPDSNIELRKLTYSQNEMLSFIHENRFCVIYKRRQEGVSTALSIYLLWLLINIPGYKIGMVCFSKHERELFRQIINNNLNKLETIFKNKNINSAILTPTNHNINYTKFSNESKIIYLTNVPTSTIGQRFDFIYFSEASFNNDFMETIQALLPCLSYDGKFILTTTELRNLKDDFFMNGDGICEFFCNGLFATTRTVIIEKKLKGINLKL